MNPKDIIIATLDANRQELIAAVCCALQNYGNSRYAVIAFEQHQDREEALLQAFLTGLKQPDHDAYLAYVVKNARQRSGEGYALEEVQQALIYFEEAVWKTLVENIPCNLQLVDLLALCTRIFTRGRDCLAQIYLQESIAIRSELDDLHDKFYKYLHHAETTPSEEGPVSNS